LRKTNDNRCIGMEMGRLYRLIYLLAALQALAAIPAVAQQTPVPSPSFTITRFEVAGNTLLAQEEIERAVAPYTGEQKQFSDIQNALEALERAYRDRGFGVVQVLLPEQDITKGVVRFRVVQRRVGKISVEGNKHFDAQNVRRSLPALKEGEVPNSQAIARNLHMAGEHPVKQTSVLLRSSASESEVDVGIRVTDDKPWRLIFSLDNTGTSETGHWRAGIGYQHTNLWNRDHSITAQYVTSPTNASDVNIYALGYRAPYYRLNSSLDLVAGYSDVNSGVVQGLFNVSGSGTIFGARWNYFLPKWGDLDQKLTAGIDYRAFQNQVIFTATGQSLVPDVTIHPVSATYSGVLRMAAAEVNFFGAASANIPGGNDGDDAAFAAARAGADANYTVFRYGATYVHGFASQWQARAAFSAQYASDPLVPGEQFGIGGPDTVRGYLLREVTGDRGYAAQFEVYTPNVSPAIGLPDALRARLLAFYDFGGVKRNNALPGEQEGKFISSAGIGLRMSYSKNVSLRVDVAQILKAAGTRNTDDQHVSAGLAIVY
jgi:hemolysin activation/secretion protein